jgi:predicted RNA-binding protein associated with RNAse of E/G family
MTIVLRPFTEIKVRLSGERVYFGCELVEKRPDRVVLRHVLTHSAQVAGVDLPPGTVTLGYFWPERPYNIYHWLEPGGTTLAHYFNLSGPAIIRENELEWQDLVVDVLVTPDHRVQVLDEDEVPSSLDDEVRERIASALNEVLAGWPEIVEETEVVTSQLLARLGE